MIIGFYYNINNKESNIEFNFKENTEHLLKIDKYYDDYYLNKEKTLENLQIYNKDSFIIFYNFIQFCIENKITLELAF
jgi:hypothetical protein